MEQARTHPIKQHRDSLGLSLGAAAEAWGLSKASLSRIENGKQQPSPERTKALSEMTGIPAKQLRPDLAELMEPESAA